MNNEILSCLRLKISVLIILLLATSLGLHSQERFLVNGNYFNASNILYDDNGDIYLLINGYSDSINIGGHLLSGTPQVYPGGIQKSPDMAVVKLNQNLTVAWIDVIQGEPSTVGFNGELRFDDFKNLFLFAWSTSGTKLFFSNGYILEKNYQTNESKRALVRYAKADGIIETIEPFSFFDNSLHWQTVNFLPNNKWIILGYHYGYSTLRGIDTVLSNPKPGFQRLSRYLALYNRQSNKYEWIKTLSSSNKIEVQLFHIQTPVFHGNEMFFTTTIKDTLYLNGQVLDWDRKYQLCHFRIQIENGDVFYKSLGEFQDRIPIELKKFNSGIVAHVPAYRSFTYAGESLNAPRNAFGLYHVMFDRDYNVKWVIADTTLAGGFTYPSIAIGDDFMITHLSYNSTTWSILNEHVNFQNSEPYTLLRAIISKEGKLKGLYQPYAEAGIFNYSIRAFQDMIYEGFTFGSANRFLNSRYDTTYGNRVFELTRKLVSGFATPSEREDFVFPTFFDETQSELLLVLKENANAEVSYIDLSGKILKTYNLKTADGVLVIPVPQRNMSTGIYILRIEIPGKEPIVQKLYRI